MPKRQMLVLPLAAFLATTTQAVAAPPTMTRDEARQLYAAGGFPVDAGGHAPTNRCNAAANPRITFVDMNGDGRKEALFIDVGPCYTPESRWYAIATKGTDGQWRRILEGAGRIATTGTAFGGWFVLAATSAGQTTRLHFDGDAYRSANAKPAAVPAPKDADAPIFLAAGFKWQNRRWESGCNDGDPGTSSSYGPGHIDERRDVNGDGQVDAVISESGIYCYGNTGQAYWIVAGQRGGGWKLITHNIGIPDFRPTRGTGGWPDIVVGGPGFCFPKTRWNGSEYRVIGHEYEGKPCKA